MKIPEWLKKEPKELFEIAKRKLREYIVVGTFALILVIAALLWGWIESQLRLLLTIPALRWQTAQLLTFVVSLLFPACFIIVLTKYVTQNMVTHKQKSQSITGSPTHASTAIKFGFVEFSGFKWKYYASDYIVENYPYCFEHQLQLFYLNGFRCPICSTSHSTHLDFSVVRGLREGAQSIVIGQIQNHIKLNNKPK